MNLCIDIGNTNIKAAFFNNKKLVKLIPKIEFTELIQLVEDNQPEWIMICSVGKQKEEVLSFLPSKENVFWLDHTTPIPFKNNYHTPQSLGMDRLAAAAGAKELYPGSHRLVIDSGTCITYEFIDQSDVYQGGAIAPGIEMRFKALNTFTSRLPLVSRSEKFELVGKNTEESIQTGVLKGILAEMQGVIEEFKSLYPEIKVIFCGGDTSFFESNLKETIFAVPELVLIGLNSILLHNVSIR